MSLVAGLVAPERKIICSPRVPSLATVECSPRVPSSMAAHVNLIACLHVPSLMIRSVDLVARFLLVHSLMISLVQLVD